MKRKLIGVFLLFVLSTQVFPVIGIKFWSNLIQGEAQISASTLLTVEEEEVEHIHFKLKNMESNHSMYFESPFGLVLDQAKYSIVSHMGVVIDRNEPILIPPPNTTV